MNFLNKISFAFQRCLGVDRVKNREYYKGANWFDITHDFAEYVLSKKKELKKQYKFTSCADEVFLQSLIMNSPFESRINQKLSREIDWSRGNGYSPYTYDAEDYNTLMSSEKLFARKFSDDKPEIVNMIYNTLKEV